MLILLAKIPSAPQPTPDRAHFDTKQTSSRGAGSGAGFLHIGRNALRNPGGRRLHRLPRKVGIPGRRLHWPVAEQIRDHRQTFTQSQRPRSGGLPQVVYPHIFEPDLPANHDPLGVQVGRAGTACSGTARSPASGSEYMRKHGAWTGFSFSPIEFLVHVRYIRIKYGKPVRP